ncbi:MAG: hypothetical protein R3E72_04565 [Steroidobacteraceae bacterium]
MTLRHCHITGKKTTLAIYDALMQARIPQSAARGVAEALEKDMEALLATKTDLRLLGAETASSFERVWRCFDQMEHRFAQVYQRFEQIDQRFEQIDKRFEQIDKRFEQVDQRFDLLDQRSERVEKRLEQMLDQDHAERMNERFADLERRFNASMEACEARLLIKLGSLMVATITVFAAIIKFL